MALSYGAFKDVLNFNARFKELQPKLTEVGFAFPIDAPKPVPRIPFTGIPMLIPSPLRRRR